MKLIITAKGDDIDETAQFCMDFIENNPSLNPIRCKCMSDGTSIVLEEQKVV